MTFAITPNPDDDVPLCSCCAGMPGVRGEVNEDGAPIAVYFAEPAGMPKYPMLRLGLVLGRFTDDAQPRDRISLVFVCRRGEGEVLLEPGEPYLGTFPELAQLGERVSPEALAARADAPGWPKSPAPSSPPTTGWRKCAPTFPAARPAGAIRLPRRGEPPRPFKFRLTLPGPLLMCAQP